MSEAKRFIDTNVLLYLLASDAGKAFKSLSAPGRR